MMLAQIAIHQCLIPIEAWFVFGLLFITYFTYWWPMWSLNSESMRTYFVLEGLWCSLIVTYWTHYYIYCIESVFIKAIGCDGWFVGQRSRWNWKIDSMLWMLFILKHFQSWNLVKRLYFWHYYQIVDHMWSKTALLWLCSSKGQQVLHHRWMWGIHCIQEIKLTNKEFNLVLKQASVCLWGWQTPPGQTLPPGLMPPLRQTPPQTRHTWGRQNSLDTAIEVGDMHAIGMHPNHYCFQPGTFHRI